MSAAVVCLRHAWQRFAPGDAGATHLRFVCSRCDMPGYKTLGEPDSAVRPLSDDAQERIANRRAFDALRHRARRSAEDPGYHFHSTTPVHSGGLPQS